MPTMLNTDQERLELLDQKRVTIVDAMTKITARFLSQVTQELPARWEQIVRRLITERPYETKALGIEGLSVLKKELHQLQSRADAIAKEHLCGPDLWIHQHVDSELESSGPSKISFPPAAADSRQRSRVSAALGRAEAEVLCLLRPVFGPANEPWLEPTQGKLSESLSQMIDAYEQLATQLEKLDTERDELRRQIASREAQQLWEQA